MKSRVASRAFVASENEDASADSAIRRSRAKGASRQPCMLADCMLRQMHVWRGNERKHVTGRSHARSDVHTNTNSHMHMHMHTHTYVHTHAHTRARALARARTHRDKGGWVCVHALGRPPPPSPSHRPQFRRPSRSACARNGRSRVCGARVYAR
eukprot:6172707-Pleurochrysis_carterae.AAC.1